MAFGAITLDTAGSESTPDGLLTLSLPTQDAYRAQNHGQMSAANLETLDSAFSGMGIMWGNGHDQLRHIVTNVLKTGIAAPETAPTVTPTGQRADATLDIDVTGGGASPYTIAAGDRVVLFNRFYFVSSLLILTFLDYHVLIGATPSETLDNLRDAIEGVKGEGTTWAQGPWVKMWVPPTNQYIEVTSKTATSIAVRSLQYGTSGNNFEAYLLAGTWTDSSCGSTGGTVGTIGYFQNGADGSGTAPEAGAYDGWAYNFLRTEDSAQSGMSPRTDATLGIAMNVALSNMEAPDDPDNDVDFIQVWRPIAAGDTLQRATDVDEDAGAATDDVSNDVLEDREAFDETLYLPYAGGYPPRARCLASYLGSVFAGGARLAADYTQGTASVTADSNTVVLTGAYPTTAWIGRMFRVTSDAREYPIVRVTPSTRTIYLATDFQGTTNGTAGYTVADKRNPNLVRYTEPLLPNSWQAEYELKGVTSKSPDGILAFVPGFGSLCCLTKTGLWTISGNGPGTYAPDHESEVAGTVSPNAALMVEQELWWMGESGIYRWGGEGTPLNITNPPAAAGEVSGIAETWARLNRRQLECVVAMFDEDHRLIRWYVPLDNDVVNRHVVVVDLNTMAISIDHCEGVTACARVEDSQGIGHNLTGDVHGNIKEVDVGTSDGCYGIETVLTVASATTRTITPTGTPAFPTTAGGLAGVPVWMVDATGTRTRAKIASNTASVLTTAEYITAPAAATQIVVGGIHFNMRTGRFHGGDPKDEKTLDPVTVAFSPQTSGQMWLATGANQDDPSVTYGGEIDLSDTTGRVIVHTQNAGIYLQLELVALAPNCSPNLHALGLEVLF